ncbi:MAG: hypothetical protein HZA28_09165 [Candidatus Omnitrophica bacterium]|nr:hypothetical protein [Candidatus Omnitrophota bacterium]
MAWVIFIVILLVAGIIFLNVHSAPHQQTGEQFQRSLEKILEGKVKPLPGQPPGAQEAFQIEFQFEGYPFVYEDIPDRGFTQEVRKAYLKVRTYTDFTLYFTEKPRSTTIKTDVIIVSNIPDKPIEGAERVRAPAPLKGLDVQTNNPALANKLLANDKMVDVLLEFRNKDSRGYPSLALKVQEGTIILEFHSDEGKVPSYHALRRNPPSIEDYLGGLVLLARFIKTV